MVTFQDLDTKSSSGVDQPILPVGWLGESRDYRIGATPPDVFKKLGELAMHAWQPYACAGLHECELCQYEPAQLGGEVYIPGVGCIYIAPQGILHYIAVHWYRPPDVFLQAVHECPPMRTNEYWKKLLANGGRPLVRLARGP